MKYRVYWTPTAEQRLAAIWMAAADREAVMRAAFRLDELLSIDPLFSGEARQCSIVRVAFDKPLGLEFEVIEDDKKVKVLSVWTIV